LQQHEAFKDADVNCILSGLGKANAAMGAQQLISEWRPDCLLSIGCAGSFNETMREGDLVIALRTAYHDVWCGKDYEPCQMAGLPLYFESDPFLVQLSQKTFPEAKTGLLITGDQFYFDANEDLRQKTLFPDALAVDMEGAAVAQAAYRYNIPFLALKVISDTHLDGNQRRNYDKFWAEQAVEAFSGIHRILEAVKSSR